MRVNLDISLPQDMINADLQDIASALTGAGFEVHFLPSILKIEWLVVTRSNEYPRRGCYAVPGARGKKKGGLK